MTENNSLQLIQLVEKEKERLSSQESHTLATQNDLEKIKTKFYFNHSFCFHNNHFSCRLTDLKTKEKEFKEKREAMKNLLEESKQTQKSIQEQIVFAQESLSAVQLFTFTLMFTHSYFSSQNVGA